MSPRYVLLVLGVSLSVLAPASPARAASQEAPSLPSRSAFETFLELSVLPLPASMSVEHDRQRGLIYLRTTHQDISSPWYARFLERARVSEQIRSVRRSDTRSIELLARTSRVHVAVYQARGARKIGKYLLIGEQRSPPSPREHFGLPVLTEASDYEQRRLERALEYAWKDRPEEALEELIMVHPLEPSWHAMGEALFLRALQISLLDREPEETLAFFQGTSYWSPERSDPVLWGEVATLFRDRSKPSSALEIYQTLLHEHSATPGLFEELAATYLEAGEDFKASRVAAFLQESYPEHGLHPTLLSALRDPRGLHQGHRILLSSSSPASLTTLLSSATNLWVETFSWLQSYLPRTNTGTTSEKRGAE